MTSKRILITTEYLNTHFLSVFVYVRVGQMVVLVVAVCYLGHFKSFLIN